jgi:hypothetical protein
LAEPLAADVTRGRLARAVELGKEKAMTVDPSSTRLNGIAPGIVYQDKRCAGLEVRTPPRTAENLTFRLPCVDVNSL